MTFSGFKLPEMVEMEGCNALSPFKKANNSEQLNGKQHKSGWVCVNSKTH